MFTDPITNMLLVLLLFFCGLLIMFFFIMRMLDSTQKRHEDSYRQLAFALAELESKMAELAFAFKEQHGSPSIIQASPEVLAGLNEPSQVQPNSEAKDRQATENILPVKKEEAPLMQMQEPKLPAKTEPLAAPQTMPADMPGDELGGDMPKAPTGGLAEELGKPEQAKPLTDYDLAELLPGNKNE